MPMDRATWLASMRIKAEALYDHFSPLYWVEFGFYPNETHQEYLRKFLVRLNPSSTILSAACGAGRYDGTLIEAGHTVVGIDQSEGMLARAREHFPDVQYTKMGLQEMDFKETFDGIICMDAMEHIAPEDWPGIMQRFFDALKSDGVLYFTVDMADDDDLQASYQRAKALGLPVVFGEVADRVDEAYQLMKTLGPEAVIGELADAAVYHFHPSMAQVNEWVDQAGMVIEEDGAGNGYKHIIARKR
jgi:2-polyprenyl-3-methyl-5-hydroxy-6-metoxy-1,4-benzoquinol methylase